MDTSLSQLFVTPHSLSRVRERARNLNVSASDQELTTNIQRQVRWTWENRWEILDNRGRHLMLVSWREFSLFLLVEMNSRQGVPVILTVLSTNTVFGNLKNGTMKLLKKHRQESANVQGV